MKGLQYVIYVFTFKSLLRYSMLHIFVDIRKWYLKWIDFDTSVFCVNYYKKNRKILNIQKGVKPY